MVEIVEIAEHMINIVEDYAELMGVSVVIENEFRDGCPVFIVQIEKNGE